MRRCLEGRPKERSRSPPSKEREADGRLKLSGISWMFFLAGIKRWIFEAWIGCHRDGFLSFLAAFAAWFNRTDQGVIQCSGTKNNSCKLRCWACAMSWLLCEPVSDCCILMNRQYRWTKPSLGCPSRWHEMCSRTRASCSLCDSTGISWCFAVLAVDSAGGAGGAAVLPVASAVMAVMSCVCVALGSKTQPKLSRWSRGTEESMEGRTTGWESSDVKRASLMWSLCKYHQS